MKVRIRLAPLGMTNMVWLDGKPLVNVLRYRVWADARGVSHVELELAAVDVDIEGEAETLKMIPAPPPFDPEGES